MGGLPRVSLALVSWVFVRVKASGLKIVRQYPHVPRMQRIASLAVRC
jgi:hypothetical protein